MHHGGAVHQVVSAHASGGSSELLERGRELAMLDECLEAVRSSSQGSVVVIGGEAGVGKTALLRRFCEERRDSLRILWGTCDPLFTPRALGPILDIVDSSGGELADSLANGARPHEIVSGLVRELWRGRRRPSSSKTCTGRTRRRSTSCGCSSGGWRPSPPSSSPPIATTSSTPATRCGWCSASSRRAAQSVAVKLAPLSLEAVARLAEPLGVDAGELYSSTAGNPFFVVEALASGAERIPPTVRDAVLSRAARLSPAAHSLLEAAAVVPAHAELWLLEALAGSEIDRLDECLASGMLMSEPPSVVFRHELARLAVEESVAPNRRLDLHRKALAALADPPHGGVDPARLAHHAEAAGDADAVLEFAPGAAARAAALGAYREAAAQYARALRFGDRLATAERARAARAPLPSVLRGRRERRGGRGDRGGARVPPGARRGARGG